MTSLYMGLLRFSEARYSSHGMAPGLVLLRPSNEHILIVRVPGARDQHGCHSTLFIVEGLRARRVPGHSSTPSKLARFLFRDGG